MFPAMEKLTQVRLSDGYETRITTRQHTWHHDEPGGHGGTDLYSTPVEGMLGALGSCLAITMKMYAERKQWPLTAIDIDLSVERLRREDYPAYSGDAAFVHRIQKQVRLHGDLSAEQRERILEIGQKCPVSRMLTEPTFIETSLLENTPIS
jgi:putative redox protein